jgi:hypothetical protein
MSLSSANYESAIETLLTAFSDQDPLRARVAEVLEALPKEVIDDFLAEPQLYIHTLEKRSTIHSLSSRSRQSDTRTATPSQTFLRLPGKDGRTSRCVTLKRRLETASLPFCLYVIAHELAHAHLNNGCWGDISDREEAADALAAAWGYTKPERSGWQMFRSNPRSEIDR